MTHPQEVVQRLVDATNRHDLEALVACFSDDVVSEQPSHPARSFHGKDQVEANWAQILGGVPDIRIEPVSIAIGGDRAWCELRFDGIRRDGNAFAMRGVTIFDVRDDRIEHVAFYIEPLDTSAPDVGEAVSEAVGR
jgi:ketosteroid isomerase-like protein